MYNVLVISIIFTGFFILNFGMLNAKCEHEFESKTREDLGACVLFAAMFTALNFVGLFIAFCLTGFAQHGLSYKLKCDES
jgi:hypothetical protein